MLRVLFCLVVSTLLIGTLPAAEPLHVRIDKLVDAVELGPQADLASDAYFLRRVYLDLTGAIPSTDETRKFLDDKSPDKRKKLVDRLLDSPEYVRHMTNVFAVMLMERRNESAEWRAYLSDSLEQNKPWNQMAAEILGSDGTDEKLRGPTNYFFVRTVEPNLMTREVGRMFFGMDLQCAQCHNHPIIDDYLQRDYYGLFAFLSRTYSFQPDKKKPALLAEKAEGDVKFESVFTGVKGQTVPRLPGEGEITEPTFTKGDEYKVKPDKKKKTVRPIPKFSRRQQLGELVAKGENLAFRRNIVNRLWGHMMGRSLVHPPDLHHSDNPPSHPELLDLLANEFPAMKFDIKAFLRELVLTKTYQRSVELPANVVERADTMTSRRVQLQTEQKKLEAQASKLDEAIEQVLADKDLASDGLLALDDEAKQANTIVAEAKKKLPGLTKALADAKRRLAPYQKNLTAANVAVTKAEASLKQSPKDKRRIATVTKAKAVLKQRQGQAASASKLVTDREKALATLKDKQAVAQKTLAGLPVRRAEVQKRIDPFTKRVEQLRKQQTQLRQAIQVAKRRADTVQAMIDYAKVVRDKSASPETVQEAYDVLTKHWSEQFVVSTLEPLSPEQMAWSVMQATGLIDRQRISSTATVNKKKKPLKPEELKAPAKVAARQKEIEADVRTRLARNEKVFVDIFGAGSGQPQYDFFATAEQALFFANGGEVRSWLTPSGTNLSARLMKLEEPDKLAEELYLSVLTRRPTAEETDDVKRYLAARPKEKSAVVQEMVWALLTSNEFRFHH